MPLSTSQNAVIAHEVRSMLEQSQAFAALAPGERRRILDSTTAVATQLVAGQLGAPVRPPRRTRAADPYALGLDEDFGGMPPMPTPGGGLTPVAPMVPGAPPVPPKWTPDERFQAEGTAAGVTQAGRMVNEVNFPGFVSSLVKGTFNAVVDASIQQMEAYGKLVNQVAMSLNDFTDQHTDPGEGARHLAKKYPNVFDMAQGSVKLKDDFDDSAMPDFQADLGMSEKVEDLEDEGAIDKLITAARTEIARGRQQLLATTILMGINRIIVTDGKINAKIVFDFKAHDTVDRTGTINDWDTSQKQVKDVEMGVADQYVKGHFEKPVPIMVSSTTATSTVDMEAKAKLTGEVSLNFRSETFPLEKMMTSSQLFQLNQAQSGARGTPPAPPPPVATPAAPVAPPAAAPAAPTP